MVLGKADLLNERRLVQSAKDVAASLGRTFAGTIRPSALEPIVADAAMAEDEWTRTLVDANAALRTTDRGIRSSATTIHGRVGADPNDPVSPN